MTAKQKKPKKKGIYEKFVKRPQDCFCALLVLVVLSPVMLVIALAVRVMLGTPVIFKQKRPTRGGRVFTMYKFRTMTDKRDAEGNLLSDAHRLTRFGQWLRSTSMDELPGFFNVFVGDMSAVGPRPQTLSNVVFMTDEQRRRQSVRAGMTGLAQVSGRNCVTWEERIALDLAYVDHITFLGDWKILFQTIWCVFKRKGINMEGMATMEGLAESLLRQGKISQQEYEDKLEEARQLEMAMLEGEL